MRRAEQEGWPLLAITVPRPLITSRVSFAVCQCHGTWHPDASLRSTHAAPQRGFPRRIAAVAQAGMSGIAIHFKVCGFKVIIWSSAWIGTDLPTTTAVPSMMSSAAIRFDRWPYRSQSAASARVCPVELDPLGSGSFPLTPDRSVTRCARGRQLVFIAYGYLPSTSTDRRARGRRRAGACGAASCQPVGDRAMSWNAALRVGLHMPLRQPGASGLDPPWSPPIVAARPSLRPFMLPGTYEPRDDGDRFHQVVRAHLDGFPADTTAAIDGVGLPPLHRTRVPATSSDAACAACSRGPCRKTGTDQRKAINDDAHLGR